MPAAICIIASVMMKDGMPMTVTPERVDEAEREAGSERQQDRDRAGQRHVGDVHVGFLQREIGDHDAGGVGDRGDREVDLGAEDHEGEPDRDDRRSPRPASGCCRDCRALRRRGCAALKKATRQSSVTNGAMLRIWRAQPARRARAAG